MRPKTCLVVLTLTALLGSTDPLAGNPDAAKLHEAETDAAREAQSLVNYVRKSSSVKVRAELREKLRAALLRQFDLQQKRRALEIANIEERLAKYKQLMNKRNASRDSIVNRRLDQLTGVGDDLGWDDTGLGSAQPTPEQERAGDRDALDRAHKQEEK
jgi:hypothetical protein